nr:DNA recombination/repair protein RecA [Armatimonadota bacterium]
GDSHMGLQARMMSQAMRKLSGSVAKTQCILVFINQLREKIGVIFGNPETTPGGKALKFYASVRLDVRRIETLKQGTDMVGNRTKVKVVKNKVAPPFRQAEFDIMFGHGISHAGGILDMAVELALAEKRGSFFSYGEVRIGQGRENAKQFLDENPDLMAEMETRIREMSLGADVEALPATFEVHDQDMLALAV